MTDASGISATADGLTVTRTFAVPPEQVWQAWTTAEHFARWFGTSAVVIPLDSLSWQPEAGGTWSAQMQLPDGNSIDWVGEFVEVEAPSRLVFTLTDQPANPAREPVTVVLTEVPGGTSMTVMQTGGSLTEEQYGQAAAGYNAFFDEMEAILTEN